LNAGNKKVLEKRNEEAVHGYNVMMHVHVLIFESDRNNQEEIHESWYRAAIR
jgi:hypothetical protein